MQHRPRDLLMRQRTQLINALRAHLAELGIVAAKGDTGVKELRAIVADEGDMRLPIDARASIIVLAAQLEATRTLIGAIESGSRRNIARTRWSQRVETIPGIGAFGGDRDRGNGGGSDSVGRPRFRGLDRAGSRARSDRGQAEARADLQAGRPLLAAHSDRRGDCRVAARALENPWEISRLTQLLARRPFSCRRRGARQQNGAQRPGR